jgi:hypothetical protein
MMSKRCKARIYTSTVCFPLSTYNDRGRVLDAPLAVVPGHVSLAAKGGGALQLRPRLSHIGNHIADCYFVGSYTCICNG